MIEIKHTIENKDDITVYFTIDHDGKIYEWHGDCPKNVDPKTHFEAIEKKLRFWLLQRMYSDDDMWPDWQRFKTEENTDLEAMQEWITKGHKNQIQVGKTKKGKPKYAYQVIEKIPWKSTHPPEIAHLAELEAADTVEKLKAVMKKVIKR